MTGDNNWPLLEEVCRNWLFSSLAFLFPMCSVKVTVSNGLILREKNCRPVTAHNLQNLIDWLDLTWQQLFVCSFIAFLPPCSCPMYWKSISHVEAIWKKKIKIKKKFLKSQIAIQITWCEIQNVLLCSFWPTRCVKTKKLLICVKQESTKLIAGLARDGQLKAASYQYYKLFATKKLFCLSRVQFHHTKTHTQNLASHGPHWVGGWMLWVMARLLSQYSLELAI